jgi:hypothetical protein
MQKERNDGGSGILKATESSATYPALNAANAMRRVSRMVSCATAKTRNVTPKNMPNQAALSPGALIDDHIKKRGTGNRALFTIKTYSEPAQNAGSEILSDY